MFPGAAEGNPVVTPERLQELIAAGETLDVEFKGEAHGPLSDTDLVDAVVCLSNRPGDEPGWLLVGVGDDGRVTGAAPRHEAGVTDATRVQALIANRTRPSDGLEPIQQEQMALQYVDKHGRITRREAVELCKLGRDQTSRLLRRPVQRQNPEMHGRGKGAWYSRRGA